MPRTASSTDASPSTASACVNEHARTLGVSQSGSPNRCGAASRVFHATTVPFVVASSKPFSVSAGFAA